MATSFCVILALWLSVYFLLAFTIDSLLKRSSRNQKVTRIQSATKHPANNKSEIIRSIISCTIFSAGTFLVYWMYLQGMTRLENEFNLSNLLLFPLMVLLLCIIQDIYFYWMHRLLHLKGFMKSIHAVHHQSHQPGTLTTFSFHPIEAVLQFAFIPPVVLLVPMHYSAAIVFLVYQMLANMLGHSGYEIFPATFKWSWLGRICNTPVYHDFHHSHSGSNYGLYFNYWDRLMKTYNPKSEEIFKIDK